MEMKYKTRGSSEPGGKPRVYFSCHPRDFDTAFPLIAGDILEHVSCAIWYDTDLSVYPDRDDLEDILKEVQLVVLAVTSTFLHEENRARNLDLPLALENHIPVLPIMLENGLENEFNKTCAEIQLVTKNVTDSTATPYDQVLGTYLKSVLVGDELAEKIRTAFDAYVFLSYRKKDRRHAHRLMRLIHENEEFRDFAIWYDEFLVPGEGFNEAIADAFNKSSLFVMTVTPSLEEKGNYVMSVEYPMARDREKKDGKFDIVSVEMYQDKDKVDGREWRIDPEKLKDHEEFKYDRITDLRDEHKKPELNRAMLDAFSHIAKKESDGSSLHRYFIGIAYLSGIDVEVNYEKALKLLESAATDEDPCFDATEKLADMYRNGAGVKRDPKKAIEWQKKLVSQLRHAYDLNHDPDEHKGYGTMCFKAMRKLSELCREAGKTAEAIESAKDALKFSRVLDQEVGVREQEHDRALILNLLGSLYKSAGDYTAAGECYTEAVGIYEKQAHEIGSTRARRDLSIALERVGDLLRKKEDLQGAESDYVKAMAIRKQLNDSASDTSTRRDYSAILTKMGNIKKEKKKYGEAFDLYAEALEIDRELSEEVKTHQAMDDYAVSLIKLGDIHKAQGMLEDAGNCYQKASEIIGDNLEKTDSLFYRDHCAGVKEKLASICKKLGDPQRAADLYREAVKERRKINEILRTDSSANSLAVSLYNAGVFLMDEEMLQTAFDIWSGLSDSHARYQKYRDMAEKKLSQLRNT